VEDIEAPEDIEHVIEDEARVDEAPEDEAPEDIEHIASSPPEQVEPEPTAASRAADMTAPVEDTAVPQAEPEAAEEPAEAEGGEPDEVGTPAGVSELFARIKADRAAAVARAHDVLAADEASPEQPATEPPAGHDAEREKEGQSATDDEVLLQRRDDAIEDVVSTLARRLKRALQDEQNEVLDRLRLHRGRAPSDLIPTSDDQLARYRLASADLLQQAASAGAEFIAPGTTVTPDIGDLADGLADSLVGPLRRRLEQGMRAGDGDDPTALADSIGAAYREWKAQRIDRLAGDAAISAFSLGTSAAAPGARLRWVVDDDHGPCPDCDDNALAGSTQVGEAYPTGQRHPPAHAGCRCLLVPATT
jgi:chemotaxis protein histidine kinase CheA